MKFLYNFHSDPNALNFQTYVKNSKHAKSNSIKSLILNMKSMM